jgi:tripartite-type tricarboxylate transporter receptor subunit TctC
VRVVLPFSPGGGTDFQGRILCDHLSRVFGQTFYIDYRPGAGSNIGVAEVARSAPDGYTLGWITVASHAINPTLYATLPFDHLRDFAPVSMIGMFPNLLVVNNALPVRTVADLISLLKKEPGKYAFASSGQGTSLHLSGEMFKVMTGTDMLHVPYKGGGPAMTDLMAGHVNLLFASVLESSGHIKAGKLKGLAVTHAQRSPALPDVPTIAEAGAAGGESGSWIALLAPAGAASDLIEKISKDIKDVVAAADVRDKLIAQGAVPQSSTPAELQKLIDADRARYGKIIRDKGLKAE